MNNSALFDFLRQLTEDSQKLADFEKDPRKAMMTAGLTEEEMEAIVGGNESSISSLLGGSASPAFFRVIRIRNIRIRRFW
jgi:hypothetical protein